MGLNQFLIMHNKIVNAALQLVPVATIEHPYIWVDAVIEKIKESGLTYEVNAFATTVEGTYQEVKTLVDTINDYLYQEQCPEWLLNVQIQIRTASDVGIAEKVAKHR